MAIQLDLRSRGRISNFERDRTRVPAEVAIKIDRLSRGQVTVAELRPDLHDVRVIQPPRHDEAGAPA